MTKKKTSTKKAGSVKKPESTIYIGPKLPDHALDTYKIFRGLPDHLQAACKNNKHLERLFVKRSDFQKATCELHNKNSIRAISFREVAKS